MARILESTVHHLVGKRFVGRDADEAQTGMRPMQLLLNAVGGCAAYDIVEMLAKRRLEVRSYTIELVGERSDETPSPFTKIRALHRFDVPGLDERTARRFAGLGMTKYCSVAASLKAEIEIEVELLHDQQTSGDASSAEPEGA